MKRTVHALLLAAFASLATASLTAQDTATAPSVEIPATDEGLPGAGPIRRYDWFKNLWRKKRSGWAKRVQEDQEAIVFLGDSITQGWGDTMGGSFPGMKVANRGISGDTTRGMLIRLKEDVLALQPSAVVLLMGTNDLEEGATPEVIAGNLKLIVAGLKAHDPTMPIMLCKVFPSSARKKRPADQIKKINELYAAAVVGDPQVTVMETWLLLPTRMVMPGRRSSPTSFIPTRLATPSGRPLFGPFLRPSGISRPSRMPSSWKRDSRVSSTGGISPVGDTAPMRTRNGSRPRPARCGRKTIPSMARSRVSTGATPP